MKNIFLVLGIFICQSLMAQDAPVKIIWEIGAKDTAVHSAIFRQINNVLTEAPDTKIEVVFHGNAIFVLTKDSSLHIPKIQKEQARGVTFAICNNSMKRLKLEASRLLPGLKIVPVAMLELARKQSEGWSYLKAGN
ncbi:MAG: DsrE family protein [bacterium]|jgi:intracellular sulfur oxidation DsrE/DsrF family protein